MRKAGKLRNDSLEHKSKRIGTQIDAVMKERYLSSFFQMSVARYVRISSHLHESEFKKWLQEYPIIKSRLVKQGLPCQTKIGTNFI